MTKIIHTEKAPAAIGPYVQAVDLGNLVLTSGQIPLIRRMVKCQKILWLKRVNR